MRGKVSFFAELKRRNVYRAAVAYGVVAWFLTQLTTQVFPFFEIPNAAIVVIALALGFPIAMCLSWQEQKDSPCKGRPAPSFRSRRNIPRPR